MKLQKRREKKLTAMHYQGRSFKTTLTKEMIRMMQLSKASVDRLMAAKEIEYTDTPYGYQLLIDGDAATNAERLVITFTDKGIAERQVQKHRPDLA